VRIVQISDTHLSNLGGITNENFDRLVGYINDVLRPDLIVNSGDVAILYPDSAEDRELARDAHRAFEAPVRVLPGNHDLGEAGEHPWMGLSVTSERVAAFRDAFGSDRFCEMENADWAIIGMNSEILSSGLPEEAEQWEWLEACASEAKGRNVVIFLHKPLWSPAPEFTEHQLAVLPGDRERLLGLFSHSSIRAVGSGHLHRYSRVQQGEILTVGAPSTAFIVKSSAWNFGLNQLGVVEYRIEGPEVDAYFRTVPTLVEEEPFSMPAFEQTMKIIEADTARV
jgi:3',5'-cyclic AMP phosphodiesterase CpdA